VFTDIGWFGTHVSSRVEYIHWNLTLSENNISDWAHPGFLAGMWIVDLLKIFDIVSHRLTASLLELLLWEGSPVPCHRVLTSFVERLTGFKITDATELEDVEPDIPLKKSCPRRLTMITQFMN
jgi:hypothetical protein